VTRRQGTAKTTSLPSFITRRTSGLVLAGDTQAGHRQDNQLAKFHHPENVRPALVCSTVLLW
jgi:hypothetical protein